MVELGVVVGMGLGGDGVGGGVQREREEGEGEGGLRGGDYFMRRKRQLVHRLTYWASKRRGFR